MAVLVEVERRPKGLAETMEGMMVDPEALAAAGAVAAALRVASAAAEWLRLHGRAPLLSAAAALPPGALAGGVRRDGEAWAVQVPAASEAQR